MSKHTPGPLAEPGPWDVEEIGCSRTCSSYFVVHRDGGAFGVHQYLMNAAGKAKRFRSEAAARAAIAKATREPS